MNNQILMNNQFVIEENGCYKTAIPYVLENTFDRVALVYLSYDESNADSVSMRLKCITNEGLNICNEDFLFVLSPLGAIYILNLTKVYRSKNFSVGVETSITGPLDQLSPYAKVRLKGSDREHKMEECEFMFSRQDLQTLCKAKKVSLHIKSDTEDIRFKTEDPSEFAEYLQNFNKVMFESTHGFDVDNVVAALQCELCNNRRLQKEHPDANVVTIFSTPDMPEFPMIVTRPDCNKGFVGTLCHTNGDYSYWMSSDQDKFDQFLPLDTTDFHNLFSASDSRFKDVFHEGFSIGIDFFDEHCYLTSKLLMGETFEQQFSARGWGQQCVKQGVRNGQLVTSYGYPNFMNAWMAADIAIRIIIRCGVDVSTLTFHSDYSISKDQVDEDIRSTERPLSDFAPQSQATQQQSESQQSADEKEEPDSLFDKVIKYILIALAIAFVMSYLKGKL